MSSHSEFLVIPINADGPSVSSGHRRSSSSTYKRSKQKKRKYSSDESDEGSLPHLSSTQRKIKTPIRTIQTEEEVLVTSDESPTDADFSFDQFGTLSSDESDFSEDRETAIPEDKISKLYKNVKNRSFEEEYSKSFNQDYDSEEEDLEESKYDLYYQKRQEYRSQMPRKKRKLDKERGYVRIEPVHQKNLVIALLDHPGSITLYQYVSVEVLSGSVSICGKELNAHQKVINVLSSESTGLIELKTVSSQKVWMNRASYDDAFKNLLKYVHTPEKAKSILKDLNSSTVMVALEKRPYQAHLQFTELYFPEVFKFRPKEFRNKSFVSPIRRISGHIPLMGSNSFCFIDKERKAVQFGEDYEDLAVEVIDDIRTANAADEARPRILVYGSKNTGKTTLLRFLINKVLSEFPSAYYLDVDPGQTEFTPPGVVSLTHVKDPIIGPAFCHQRKPVSMIFTGGVSADISPHMYARGVAKLMQVYHNQDNTGALFVNTMGWVKGIGLSCLKGVMKSVKPTIVIEMTNHEDSLVFDYTKHTPSGTKFFQIRSPFYKLSPLSAQHMRSLSLLSYFGRNQIPYERPKYLNAMKPFCVCWDDIAVYNFKKKVAPMRLIESMNASVVALCHVQSTALLDHHNEAFPMTLEDEPDNDCIGFGIVRAVDEVQHLLYIVTPLKLNELLKVNAIIKGNVMLPDSFILKQNVAFTPLHFTQEEIRDVKTAEDEPSEEMISDITEKYRKSIKRRYGKTKKRE